MIINGDALTVLKRMDSESVHMAVTSSPYFGLRSYNTEPQIWDGDPSCQHEWGTVHPPGYRSSDTKPGPLQNEGNTNRQNLKSDVCSKCGCYDDQTELLTERGWIKFKDLTITTKCGTVINEKLEFVCPTNIFEYDYSGNMYKFSGKNINLVVTPNHNMYVMKRNYIYNNKKRIRDFEFISAENVKHCYKIKRTFEWDGISKEQFDLPIIPDMRERIKNNLGIKIKMENWLEFLGLYIAEGSCRMRSRGNNDNEYTVNITQTIKKSPVEEILNALPFHYNYVRKKDYVIYNKSLYYYLKSLGKTYDKYIPEPFKQLTPSLLKHLLRGLMIGDGHIRKDGRRTYYTSSKRLADDVQEIVHKMGYASSLYIKNDKREPRVPIYAVHIIEKETQKQSGIQNISKVPYVGKVYCCEVNPSHLLIIRRSGKVAICGNSWKGELGSEPTPEDFIRHLTTIYRELKRVLRNDGTFWANIGDSFASGKGTCFNPGGNENSLQKDCKESGGLPLNRGNKSTLAKSNLKPKDMMGIPWALAFSLRADGAASPQTMYTVERIRSALLDDYDTWNDVPKNTKRTIEDLDEEWAKAQKGGWYLRADLPWVKRNSLPSSVTDRPCSSIEHVFLFSKSKKYFYDHVATMQPSSESYNKDKRPRGKLRQTVNENSKYPDEGQFMKQDGTGNPTVTGFNARYEDAGTGLRFMRDSDFFFKTWQGLLHNEDGEPMALVVNPRGYKGAHFAAFPIKLCEPLILAGTSDRGVCRTCGAPWVRQTEKMLIRTKPQNRGDEAMDIEGDPMFRNGTHNEGLKTNETNSIQTTGWSPSCSYPNNIPIPAIVLDPFGGSSATGVACKLHNRNYIGIELNPEYCKLGEQRVRDGK